MKVRKYDERTIIDLLINYGNLDNLYDFLQQEEINYIKKDQLSSDFYTINDTWQNADSKFLIDNNYTVISRDDEYYYPTTSTDIIFENIKVNNLTVNKSGTTFTFNIYSTNYGYLVTGTTMYIEITDVDNNTIYSGNITTDEIGYLYETSNSFSTTITEEYFLIEIYQEYSPTIKKNIYKKEYYI